MDEMKLPPESVEQNLDNQNFLAKDRDSVPNSLENLYNLLTELTTENPQPELTTLESSVTHTDSAKEVDEETKQRDQKSTKNEVEPNLTQKNGQLSATPSKASTQVTPQTKIKPNLLAEAQLLQNLAQSSSSEVNHQSSVKIPEKSQNLLEGEIIESKKENKADDKSTKLNSWINFDSINQEDLTKIYFSQQWVIEKEKRINQLASSIDNLLPLVVELSKTQANTSQDYILKALVPIIDRVIKQRSAEDSQIMASAIANILPDAIQQEIKDTPESIGKAIAPEVALSIREQIRLDENAIAQALGSEMGKAIKTQIAMERDAMVDALYPVIGSTISKYMAEVVQSINEKVDNALSPVGIQRKVRAKLQGVSEAELILRESYPYSVRAIFLIHKTSGLIIRELQPNQELIIESDLLAGMLTAIRSFANDCIVANSQLDQIDYDDFQILLESAGYCYLAVVVNGEPSRQFRDRMRAIFSKIILKYGQEIEKYQGDPQTVPDSLQLLLEELNYQEGKPKSSKSPKTLYWLLAFLMGSILLPWGIVKHRASVAQNIEQAVAIELDRTPELSVYRLIPKVKKGELTLTGRVPSLFLRDLAAKVSNQIAKEKALALNNQIVAINVPVDPTVTAQEVSRITKVLNQKAQALIKTTYQNRIVTIDGLILNPAERQNLLETFISIPGVEKVVFVIQQKLPTLNTRIYFPSNSSEMLLKENFAKITEIKQFLAQYPLIKLKIIGHSDREGTSETNQKIGQARANKVYQTLIAQGIAPQRLEIINSLESPPNLSPNQPLWLSRCVRFESFIAKNQK